jgi:hypothetical protein
VREVTLPALERGFTKAGKTRADFEISGPMFVVTGANDITLWTAATADGKAKRLTTRPLNTAFGFTSAWLPDNYTLICLAVPVNRGPEPAADLTPKGPVVDENLGKTSPARTYQDLLKDPRDEALFEHYVSAQPLRVTVDGEVEEIGAPALITGIEPSPDGRFLLVTSVHRPFSYRVPFYYFPERSEVWDLDGARRLVADTAPGVPFARRRLQWPAQRRSAMTRRPRSSGAEARDGGDARWKPRCAITCSRSPRRSRASRASSSHSAIATPAWTGPPTAAR